MSIICSECGSEIINDKVETCPVCGCPIDLSAQPILGETNEQSAVFSQPENQSFSQPPVSPIGHQQAYYQPLQPNVPTQKGGINVTAIISVLIGFAIVGLGIFLMKTKITDPSYYTPNYDAKSASFGADFYTYIYDASDTMVSELDTINRNIAATADYTNTIVKAIYYSIGMLLIGIGLGTVGLSLPKLKKR